MKKIHANKVNRILKNQGSTLRKNKHICYYNDNLLVKSTSRICKIVSKLVYDEVNLVRVIPHVFCTMALQPILDSYSN